MWDPFFKFFENTNKFSVALQIFLVAQLTLGFFIPLVFYQSPWGTDVHYHLAMTQRMASTNSIAEFETISLSQQMSDIDYPFGLWLLGSTIIKITGMEATQMVNVFPFLLAIFFLILFYTYANTLLKGSDMAVASLIFFLSMPLLALGLMNYSSSHFTLILIVMIAIIFITPLTIQKFLILGAVIFALIFSHCGSYIFLLLFSIAYFLLYIVIWKKFSWGAFFTTFLLLTLYVVTIDVFPFIHPKYIYRGYDFLDITAGFTKKTSIGVFGQMGELLYNNLIVGTNLAFALLFSGFLLMVGLTLYQIRERINLNPRKYLITIPFINEFTDVSHGILLAPFWMGPIQVVFSIFGLKKLDSKGWCIFITLFLSAFLPGSIQSEIGTGSLRMIIFLYLIVPILAAAGFFIILNLLERIQQKHVRQIVPGLFILIIFVPLMVIPIVGNMHYEPRMSGTPNEIQGFKWLGNFGDSSEKVVGNIYRNRPDVYANKTIPADIPTGTETRRYLSDITYSYFGRGSEKYTLDLWFYDVRYLITGARQLEAYGKSANALTIDQNTALDKILAAEENFGIYQIRSARQQITKHVYQDISDLETDISENAPVIEHIGSSYIVSNQFYKIKLKEDGPIIDYLGSETNDYLGFGDFSDYVVLSQRGNENLSSSEIWLPNLRGYSVALYKNHIQYKGTIFVPRGRDPWATVIIDYKFLERSVQKTILISNDYCPENTPIMDVDLTTYLWTPMKNFEITYVEDGSDTTLKRTVYTSRDFVTFKDRVVREAFFQYGSSGINIEYGDTAPYPSKYIKYRGSELYDYGEVEIGGEYMIYPAETLILQQSISIGPKAVAEDNIDFYNRLRFPPWVDGKIPVVIIDTMGIAKPGGAPGIYYPGLNITLSLASSDNYANNLNSIKAAEDKKVAYLLGPSVNPPIFDYNKEGMRNPKIPVYKGDFTSLIKLPISKPSSSAFRERDASSKQIFGQWNASLQAVREYGGVAVFLWGLNDFKTEELKEFLTKQENRIQILSATEYVQYYRALANVAVDGTVLVDEATIHITNNNDRPINGTTIECILPLINGKDPYDATGATILSREKLGGNVRMLVGVDLAAYQTKDISIYPTIERKEFRVDFSQLTESNNQITIRDNNNDLVSGATLFFQNQRLSSNNKGIVKISLPRGIQTLRIEKPGYISLETTVEVKGRIFNYLPF